MPRRVGGQRRARPARRAGEVAVHPVGEHDVRDHPVGPLRRQQGVEFDHGPLHAQRCQADRDERGVPAPHVRIEQRRRRGHHAQVVAAKQVGRAGGERSVASVTLAAPHPPGDDPAGHAFGTQEADGGADHRSMNMLSALSPASEPIDPLDPGATIRARVAVAAQVKVMDVAKQMGQDLVALLDPAVGNNLNRSA